MSAENDKAITSGEGRYIRDEAGVWRYADSGEPVPGAEDMTITNRYNLPVYGDDVIVPRSLALNEPDLAWCLEWNEVSAVTRYDYGRRRGMGRDPNIPDDAICVPLAEWDRRASEVLGMWCRGTADQVLLTARQIAELLGVGPRTVYGWIERREDFPAEVIPSPAARWDREEVLAWHREADLRPGAPRGNRNASKEGPDPA